MLSIPQDTSCITESDQDNGKTRPRPVVGFEDQATAQGFTQVPNVVLRDGSLSPGSRLVFSLLLSFAWQTGGAYPGQTTLAEAAGSTCRSVRNWLKELEAAGLIWIHRRGKRQTNYYTIRRFRVPEGDRKKSAHHSGGDRKKSAHHSGGDRKKSAPEEYSGKHKKTQKGGGGTSSTSNPPTHKNEEHLPALLAEASSEFEQLTGRKLERPGKGQETRLLDAIAANGRESISLAAKAFFGGSYDEAWLNGDKDGRPRPRAWSTFLHCLDNVLTATESQTRPDERIAAKKLKEGLCPRCDAQVRMTGGLAWCQACADRGREGLVGREGASDGTQTGANDA